MAERYTHLYTAENDLYVEGSPVILSAGALLKDNETGKVLAQLKIKSIAEKNIKAVKVTVASYDTIGKPLDGAAAFEYLDLDVRRDEQFGQKTLIPLPNTSARILRDGHGGRFCRQQRVEQRARIYQGTAQAGRSGKGAGGC